VSVDVGVCEGGVGVLAQCGEKGEVFDGGDEKLKKKKGTRIGTRVAGQVK
jgi:hypothetical protein